MSHIKIVEKIKTHILCSERFSENRAVYEMVSKNVVELEAAENMALARGMQDN